jgi:hypothetical protein
MYRTGFEHGWRRDSNHHVMFHYRNNSEFKEGYLDGLSLTCETRPQGGIAFREANRRRRIIKPDKPEIVKADILSGITLSQLDEIKIPIEINMPIKTGEKDDGENI